MNRLIDLLQLDHQPIVDLEPAGRVDDHIVQAFVARPLERITRDIGRAGLGALGMNRDVQLLAKRLELGDRGRPIDIGRNQQRALALLAQIQRQLSRQRGLAGALQAIQQDHRRAGLGLFQRHIGLAKQLDQLIVDDLDHLLRRRQALGDLFADRLLGHLGDEILDDLEVDIGFEQRQAHLLHALADIVLGQLAFAA